LGNTEHCNTSVLLGITESEPVFNQDLGRLLYKSCIWAAKINLQPVPALSPCQK